jgi:uracil-DNA glycosylase
LQPQASLDLDDPAVQLRAGQTVVTGAAATTADRLRAPTADHFAQVSVDWRAVTDTWLHGAAGQSLCAAVDARVAAGAVVYPPAPLRALELTSFDAVRVLILGQDPYHGAGEAEGLAFSVQRCVKIPPSLRNIHAELASDLGLPRPAHGSLLAWARAGVLLLNTTLTVEQDQPASHARLGWATLTDALVAALARRAAPCIFVLWGAHAQAKAPMIDALGGGRHGVFMSNHPSPLAARRPPVPFLGSRPFSRANTWLGDRGLPAIDWSLPS